MGAMERWGREYRTLAPFPHTFSAPSRSNSPSSALYAAPSRAGPPSLSDTLIITLNHCQASPSSFINYSMQPAVRKVRLKQPIAVIPHLHTATLNEAALLPRLPPRHSRHCSPPSGCIRQSVFIQSNSYAETTLPPPPPNFSLHLCS